MQFFFWHLVLLMVNVVVFIVLLGVLMIFGSFNGVLTVVQLLVVHSVCRVLLG